MSPSKHVLCIPVPALGHIIPMLHLARKVAQSQTVSFAVSEFRLNHMRSRGIISPTDERSINFYGIPDGMTEGDERMFKLDTMAETRKITFEGIQKFVRNVPLTNLGSPQPITTSNSAIKVPVEVIILDLSICIVPGIFELGIPCIGFNTAALFVFANKLSITENTPDLPDSAFFSAWEHIPGGPVPKFYKTELNLYNKVLPHFTAYVFNTVAEIERDSIPLLKDSPVTSHIPALYVGPLFLDADQSPKTPLESLVGTWLDNQERHSVIYVSFGSLAVAVEAQVVEIAKALISLKKPFIWSLSSVQQKFLPSELTETLPTENGFACKFLILPWTPQKQILSHKSTGVFITHCGWNSTMESLIYGVPIVAWPMFGDQYGNAVMVEKWGAGVTVPGTSMLFTEVIQAEVILEAANKVLAEADGNSSFRKRAEETGNVMSAAARADGSSHKDLEKVVTLGFL